MSWIDMPRGVLAGGAFFLFLCVRGVLLWLVIPIACCTWLVTLGLRPMFRQPHLTLGKVVGWADLNLSAAIAQVLLRPLGHKVPFTPWAEVNNVKHRVGLADPC